VAAYRFELAQPIQRETQNILKAVAGLSVARNGRAITTTTNAAWLAQASLQYLNLAVRHVVTPSLPPPFTVIPRIPEMRERVSGLEQPWPLYLLDWQKDFLLKKGHEDGVHMWIAPGGGKTIAATAWGLLDPRPLVFVTRSAARRTIRDDVKRFTTASWYIIDGRQTKPLPDVRVYIVGWDTLVDHVDELMAKNPATVIFDEIHRAKNWKRWIAVARKGNDGHIITDATGKEKVDFHLKDNMTGAAARLSRAPSIRRRLGATGTPIKDRLRDLWAQLDLIEPGGWGGFYDWARRYLNAAEGMFGGLNTTGRAAAPLLEELMKRLSLVVYQVPYSVTHASLPPKRRQVTYISKTDLLKDEGVEARKAILAAASQGAHAMAHARLAASAARKRPILIDAVIDSIGEKTKIVVLTGLRAEVEKLYGALQKKLPDIAMWHASGSTDVKTRDAIREAYMDHPGPCVLVGTSAAWGESIQLHDTDVAHIGMLPFTPGEVIQLEGRFGRVGQKRSCLLQYHVAEGTYDEHVAQLLLDKLPAVERVVGGGELSGFGRKLTGVEDEDKLIAELMARLATSDVELDPDDHR
jgi:hypothetical protein